MLVLSACCTGRRSSGCGRRASSAIEPTRRRPLDRAGGDRRKLAWVVWTLVVIGGGTVPEPTQIFGLLAVIFAQRLTITGNDGWAFLASGFAIAAAIGQMFISLYPNVMVSSTNAAYNLTVNNRRRITTRWS